MSMDNTPILERTPVKLNLEGNAIPATIILTRTGRIFARLSDSRVLDQEPDGVFDRPHLQKFYDELSATTASGTQVTLENVHITFEGRGSDNDLRIKSIPSISTARIGRFPETGCDQLTVEYTIINLRPLLTNNKTYEPLIRGDSWTASVKVLEPSSVRPGFEASAKMRIQIDPKSDSFEMGLKEATEVLENILALARFFQGCGNDAISSEIIEVQGGDYSGQQVYQEVDANLGTEYHVDTLLVRNVQDSINEAYNRMETSSDLPTILIDYYIDALNDMRSNRDRIGAVMGGLSSYLVEHEIDPASSTLADIVSVFEERGITTNDLNYLEQTLANTFEGHQPTLPNSDTRFERMYTTLVVLLMRTIEEMMMKDAGTNNLFDVRPEELRPLV